MKIRHALFFMPFLFVFAACSSVVEKVPTVERIFTFEGLDQNALFSYTGEFLAGYFDDGFNGFLDKDNGKISGTFYVEKKGVLNIIRLSVKYSFIVRDGRVKTALMYRKTIISPGDPIFSKEYKGLRDTACMRISTQREVQQVMYEEFFKSYKSYVTKRMQQMDNF